MKKNRNKHNIVQAYRFLSKRKKKMFIKAVIMSMFLLGINVYAWFAFFDKFDGNINANVIAWDVTFFDDDETVDSVAMNINSLYPGMNDYEKQIMVSNKSDVKAVFSYSISKVVLFGETFLVDDVSLTSDQLLSDLGGHFPFQITFNQTKDELNSGGDSAYFGVYAVWPFEHEEPYFLVNSYFDYDGSIQYYQLVDGEYVLDGTVSSDNFASKVESGIYIESDDADTYWGGKAADYKNSNPNKPCLELEMKITVTQVQT